ncbi:MAG: hypothetical protein Q9188_004209 [Gyalolechia gomerana]
MKERARDRWSWELKGNDRTRCPSPDTRPLVKKRLTSRGGVTDRHNSENQNLKSSSHPSRPALPKSDGDAWMGNWTLDFGFLSYGDLSHLARHIGGCGDSGLQGRGVLKLMSR